MPGAAAVGALAPQSGRSVGHTGRPAPAVTARPSAALTPAAARGGARLLPSRVVGGSSTHVLAPTRRLLLSPFLSRLGNVLCFSPRARTASPWLAPHGFGHCPVGVTFTFPCLLHPCSRPPPATSPSLCWPRGHGDGGDAFPAAGKW